MYSPTLLLRILRSLTLRSRIPLWFALMWKRQDSTTQRRRWRMMLIAFTALQSMRPKSSCTSTSYSTAPILWNKLSLKMLIAKDPNLKMSLRMASKNCISNCSKYPNKLMMTFTNLLHTLIPISPSLKLQSFSRRRALPEESLRKDLRVLQKVYPKEEPLSKAFHAPRRRSQRLKLRLRLTSWWSKELFWNALLPEEWSRLDAMWRSLTLAHWRFLLSFLRLRRIPSRLLTTRRRESLRTQVIKYDSISSALTYD